AARKRLAHRLAHLAEANGYVFRRLFIRHQTTLWGSCSTANNISLNLRLAALPPELADYVMLHELVHIRHRGHGPAFWAELARNVPDARERQSRLRECGLAIL
ncbi:MAG: M48 family metallopeptidase, partial [Candidatus Aminicenantes bacterium]|nr:M48 family metallopeptidase [Candidatus Aminicenantes bacterium]